MATQRILMIAVLSGSVVGSACSDSTPTTVDRTEARRLDTHVESGQPGRDGVRFGITNELASDAELRQLIEPGQCLLENVRPNGQYTRTPRSLGMPRAMRDIGGWRLYYYRYETTEGRTVYRATCMIPAGEAARDLMMRATYRIPGKPGAPWPGARPNGGSSFSKVVASVVAGDCVLDGTVCEIEGLIVIGEDPCPDLGTVWDDFEEACVCAVGCIGGGGTDGGSDSGDGSGPGGGAGTDGPHDEPIPSGDVTLSFDPNDDMVVLADSIDCKNRIHRQIPGIDAFCKGTPALESSYWSRIDATIRRIKSRGGVCADIAAEARRLALSGRLRIYDGSTGAGWSDKPHDYAVLADYVFGRHYYQNTWGSARIPDFALSHEIDHVLGLVHVSVPGVPEGQITEHAILCGGGSP